MRRTADRSIAGRSALGQRGRRGLVVAVGALAIAATTIGAVTAAAPKGDVKALKPCKAPQNESIDDLAAESYISEYGGTVKAARRWLAVQAGGMQLFERIQESPARKDYMRASFDNRRKKVRVEMRNHRHDPAIRRCTSQMGITSYLRIGIAKWSDADIDRAMDALSAAFPDPPDGPLFGTSAGAEDFYRIDVYPAATPEQYAQIEAKARELGVGYRIRRDADGPDIGSVD